MTIQRVTQVSDLDALLNHVFSDLEQHPDKAEGAGQLLFEMCKGVRNMFHSCAANVSFLSKDWMYQIMLLSRIPGSVHNVVN